MTKNLTPWDNWLPGALCETQLNELFELGHISKTYNSPPSFDGSSFNLTLSDKAYKMLKGAVTPVRPGYLHELEESKLIESVRPDSEGEFLLEPRQTYLFKLREKVERLGGTSFYGQATAKSSVGRVDVLARLIADGMHGYDSFDPDVLKRGNGDLFLEITPLTFHVKVIEGCSLSQLRFFYGDPKESEIKGKEIFRCCMKGTDTDDGSLSIDLTPVPIGGIDVVGFLSHTPSGQADPIPLFKAKSRSNPCKYWRFILPNDERRMVLEKGSFYILRSREKLALPSGVAVYCRAIDETLGEMRIHYAGFVHPHFGRPRKKEAEIGTPLIFEVRGHDVSTSISDGAKMARLTFYKMSKDAKRHGSAYDKQNLKLSKFFANWPKDISVDGEGKVVSNRRRRK
jgi:dCTP deaminase